MEKTIEINWIFQLFSTIFSWYGRGFTLPVSTCVDFRWVAKRWKTCVDLPTNLSSTKVIASGWPNETHVELKSKTCVDLRRLASPFGQGFKRWVLSTEADKSEMPNAMEREFSWGFGLYTDLMQIWRQHKLNFINQRNEPHHEKERV